MTDEYIHREDAVDAVCAEWCGAHDAHCDACAEVHRINALPSADVVPVETLKAEIYKLKHQSEQGFGNHDYYVGYISALSTVEGILAWMDEKE